MTDQHQQIMDLLGKQEELDPELQPYLIDIGGMMCLKHPLVFNIMHIPQFNAQMNAILRQKKKMLAEAEAEKKWGSYIFLHERPHRFEAFASIRDRLTDKQYWELLSSVWSDTENLWQYHFLVPSLIDCARPGRENMLDVTEGELYNSLPEQVAVYRGHQMVNREGWSWSLSYWQAKWFAQRFQKRNHGVVRGIVNKQDIIAVILGRSEKEIIANPENVVDIKAVSIRRSKWLTALRDECVNGFKLGPLSQHGPWHWEKVEMNALALAKATKGADATVCRLFAFIHDSQRLNENDDPFHGERAAGYVRKGLIGLDKDQIEKLAVACEGHEKGLLTDDPTIGCCWDADRLDLIRVGIVPDPKLLSTKAAKELMWKI